MRNSPNQFFTVQSFRHKRAIIWDWNGTLLNDIEICIRSMNRLLEKRSLPILGQDLYRQIFTFPVKDYYRKAGFDFEVESFEKPALEFIQHYYSMLDEAKLFPGIVPVLNHFKSNGFYQSVLSAMEHDSLIKSLKDKGIHSFFDDVSGIDDHFAHSKLENGFNLLRRMEFQAGEIILIGDTLHDLEVAQNLGIDCILIANGHQSAARLREKTKHVIEDVSALISAIPVPKVG